MTVRQASEKSREKSFGKERRYRGSRSFAIPVWNGIFEHYGRIGEALWEFLWCVDGITKEVEGVGLVHGGAPVKLERIVCDLNGDKETVRRHLKKLEAERYIEVRRTPYGQVIKVLNSRKFGIWKKQKLQSAVSQEPTGEPQKLTYESEKPTGESEKPHFAVSKEDSAKRLSKKVQQTDPESGGAFSARTAGHCGLEASSSSPDDASPTLTPKNNGNSKVPDIRAEAFRVISADFPNESPDTINAVFDVILGRARSRPRSASFLIHSFRFEVEDIAAQGAKLEFYASLARLHRGVEERTAKRAEQ